MSDTRQILERFHRALVEEIRTQRPEYLTGPFTVAEIYQNLVPYGSHRDRIGVRMNGDYEDALLRLLAGEGGYLILDSEPALRDLRAELKTPNPNTGLYREYAAVDVRLNQAFIDVTPSGARERLATSQTMGFGEPLPTDLSPAGMTAYAADIAAPGVDVFVERAEALPGETAARACLWCRAELPARDNLNFCPFCGTNLRVVPCRECGEELEPSWRFCVACGTEVSG